MHFVDSDRIPYLPTDKHIHMNNSRLTFNVLYYIKKAATLRDGQHPIYCRITVSGSRTEFSVNRTVDANIWSQGAGRSTGKDQASRTLNQYLEQMKVKIYNAQVSNDIWVVCQVIRHPDLLADLNPFVSMAIAQIGERAGAVYYPNT